MTSIGRFEGALPALLENLAEPQTPDYFDDLFWQTAHTSQRSAWTIPERWLPMLQIARQPVVAQPPWRAIGLLVLLVGALAASLILAGTQHKLPPLTGPASNGLVAFSRDGDILTFDPRTNVATVVIGGSTIDSDPIWSQDGTRLLFRRQAPDMAGADFVMIARANGSGVKQLTPEPMPGLASYTLSPDGRAAAIIADVKGAPALFVADSDGRSIKRLEIGSFPFGASFDPTGSRILFVGAQGVDWSYSGLYLIDVDGSNLTTLVQPALYAPMEGAARWSPDGSLIAYGRWEANQSRVQSRVHVIGADGTNDRPVGHLEGVWYEAVRGWSPDGRRISIERSTAPANSPGRAWEPVIVALDGATPDLTVGFQTKDAWNDEWSPDGTVIQVQPEDANGNGLQQLLWNTTNGTSRSAPWTADSYPAWQRVAP